MMISEGWPIVLPYLDNKPIEKEKEILMIESKKKENHIKKRILLF